MRILLILLLLPVIGANQHHENSLKHVQKRHDIPLEFIMNSHEHSDIRRSVKLSSDKFIVRTKDQRPSGDSSEVVGDSESVPDKFDQPSYDFMLPEGKSEKSTILAVLDFITRKYNAKPEFFVNFDENHWFAIGEVQKTRADNADVYKATVILREGADVAIQKTDGGLYKFVVEAQHGDVVLATTNVAVDVISLAPTTKRVRVTVPSEPKRMESSTVAGVEVEGTTTSGLSSEDSEVTTTSQMDSEGTEASTTTPEDSEGTTTSVTSSEDSKEGAEVTTSSVEDSEEDAEGTTTSVEDSEGTTTSVTSSEDSEVTDASTTSEETSEVTTTSEMSSDASTTAPKDSEDDVKSVTTSQMDSEATRTFVTSSENSEITTLTSEDSEDTTTPSEPSTTSETSSEGTTTTPEATTSSEPSTTTPEDSESSTPPPTPSEPSPTSQIDVEASGTLPTSSDDLTTSTTSSELAESSGEPLDFSGSPNSEDVDATSSELLLETSEDPLTGPVTILPLKTTQDGKMEVEENNLGDLEVSRDHVKLPRGIGNGDVIRNLDVIFRSSRQSDDVIYLKIEPAEILEIRPSILKANEVARIFFKNSEIPETAEIIANVAGAEFRRRLKIDVNTSSESDDVTNSKSSEESELLKMETITMEIPANSELGTKIGSIPDAFQNMRILNPQSKFSLMGNDVILTSSEFPLQNTHLILTAKNGSLSLPLQIHVTIPRVPRVRTSDDVIRISDNKIISPFAVITENTDKGIRLDGDAAEFLGFVKSQDNLFQLIVSNSAAPGHYHLKIHVDSSEISSGTISVHVTNSQSHAHFRKATYHVEIDVKKMGKMEVGRKILQVELEGVPIDEAKIMVLSGNPGWVTVEGYGGNVNVGRFDGPIYSGKSVIRIGAVDKKTWTILTETLLEIDVKNGAEKVEKSEKSEKNSEKSRILEKTFNREMEIDKFDIDLEGNSKNNIFKLDPRSIIGIDEQGRQVKVDPTSITTSKTGIHLNPSSVKTLRLLKFTVTSSSPTQKIDILVRLISTPEFLDQKAKNASRPVYPSPWTRENHVIHVELREELASGQVVGVFPAISATWQSGKSDDVTQKIEGEMKDAFDFDAETGELKIRRRIDFESLEDHQKTFQLILTSGDVGFESRAVLDVKVIDVDDNSPVLENYGMEMISLPENLPPLTKIAEFNVTDSDGTSELDVEIQGRGSENYVANMTSSPSESKLSIFTSPTSKIDRETENSHALLIRISDGSKNSNRYLLPIRILDVNDNAPEFTQKIYELEAVEDWPRGVVLSRISARDSDDVQRSNSKISYSIPGGSDVISVNSTTGVVTVAGDLWGKAREAPYTFRILAEDSGSPPLNSTSMLSLKIRSKLEVMTETSVEILDPKNGVEIVVKENLPLDTKIFKAAAELRGISVHGEISYSLKDLISDDKTEDFAIDKKSGDIFAVRPIDYERRREYTLLVTASNSDDEKITSSRILKIHVENEPDNEPRFLESATPLFEIPRNISKPTAIGRLTAENADKLPIFYQILKKCGSESMAANFSIDPEFGEIIYSPKRITVDEEVTVELCFMATSQKSKDTSEIFFDSNSPNMRKVLVKFVEENGQNRRKLLPIDNWVAGNMSITRIGGILDKIEIPVLEGVGNEELQLENLQFVPANYELGRDIISPEGSVELNRKTGELVANGKILDTPQGVYTARISNSGVKQIHHIRDDRKLRYVLAMSKNEFGANAEKLKRQILEGVGESEKSLQVHFDEPLVDKKNGTWTSVCFYLTRDNAILSDTQMTSLINTPNISKLHHIFKVLNVDSCSPKSTSTSFATSSDFLTIPTNTLILIGVVGVLVIALIGLLVFVCCVSRYQRHLKMKTSRLRGTSSSAGSYYKSPNLIPPPYMHTPPLPPPPPPAAIGYY